MRQPSMDGYRFSLECFRSKDMRSPKATPSAIDTLNDSKKIPIPWNTELT